jgi:Cytochrome c
LKVIHHTKQLSFYVLFSCWSFSVHAEQVDLVAQGKQAFSVLGCAECHSSVKNDQSIKLGPSLYNLFLTTPRDREVLDPVSGKKIVIKADRDYFTKSIRNALENQSIAETGATKGQAYPPIMPQFTPAMASDKELESIWHYLRQAADEPQAGPAVVMGEKQVELKTDNPLDNPTEVVVTKRPRVFRAPLRHASGRAIHVGLPVGINYTFDPRMLSVRSVWSGGFLNLAKEQKGRSTPGSEHGQDSSELLDGSPALTPLTGDGRLIDFEFKEPDLLDDEAIIKHLWKGGDFLKELASWDCEFIGYSQKGNELPEFHFRIEKNQITQCVSFGDDGSMVVDLSGQFLSSQSFQLRKDGFKSVTVDGGTLANGKWTLPAGENVHYQLRAKVMDALPARKPLPAVENFSPQEARISPSVADLPAGYQIETWEPPKDTYGRNQLFEPTAIAVAKNGTIVVGTRTAGIWRIKNKRWELFAEGTFECLGLWIEDDAGDTIVIGQKPELTRLKDLDRDGRADEFITVCDDFGFHGNYSEYTHGPVRDAAGNYYFTLNLVHTDNQRASYHAGGIYMGSMGGYRGWCCRVTPAGVFEPFAPGLRSPAGIGLDPDGRLLYTENQGEYMGSSKVSYLYKDHFYGHPSGLVSLPGMRPDSPEIAPEKWQKSVPLCPVWFPHEKLANSPGNPTWDLSQGKFGAYARQMFIGDQTLSTVMRIGSEKVGEVDQGCVMPFASKLASGIMRPCFLPDGSLLLGQTGRGWQAAGGNEGSLQRIFWDGKTTAADIHHVSVTSSGFEVFFTTPLAESLAPADVLAKVKVESWTYTDTSRYGSDEDDKHPDAVSHATISADRKSLKFEVQNFSTPSALNRLYWIQVTEAEQLFSPAIARDKLEAYYTVRAVPQ